MDIWAPMFAVALRIQRQDMLALSVPEMVEHVDYWAEMNRGSQDG